jgi:Spy/CpxP family protein refolding chaperone
MPGNATRVWFSLFVLAVFCVGLAVGLVLGRRMPPPPFGRPGMFMAGPGGPAGRGGRPGMLIERLNRELQLSDDQRARVQSIFEARRPHLEAIQRDTADRAREEQRQLQAEIRKVLTPEQQGRFDRWLEQQPRGRRGRTGDPQPYEQ